MLWAQNLTQPMYFFFKFILRFYELRPLYTSDSCFKVDELVILLRNNKKVKVLKIMDTPLNDVLYGMCDALTEQKQLEVCSHQMWKDFGWIYSIDMIWYLWLNDATMLLSIHIIKSYKQLVSLMPNLYITLSHQPIQLKDWSSLRSSRLADL